MAKASDTNENKDCPAQAVKPVKPNRFKVSLYRDATLGGGKRSKGDVIAYIEAAPGSCNDEVRNLMNNPGLQIITVEDGK